MFIKIKLSPLGKYVKDIIANFHSLCSCPPKAPSLTKNDKQKRTPMY